MIILSTREEKLEFVKSAIENIKGTKLEKTLNETTLLFSLGLDSLDVVELQLFYEDKSGKIAEDPLTPVLTAGQLIDLMK
jgi:acyl carrier protein